MGISRNFVVKLPVRCQSFSAHLQDDTYLPMLQGSHQKAPILGFQEHFLMEHPVYSTFHRVWLSSVTIDLRVSEVCSVEF
jgi:hypothetical protein